MKLLSFWSWSLFLVISCPLFHPTMVVAQKKDYRIKEVYCDKPGDAIPFVLPPHAEIAGEGLFGCSRTLHYRPHSRFAHRWVIFHGLDSANDYSFLIRKIEKPECLSSASDQTVLLQNKDSILDPGIPTPGGGGLVFYAGNNKAMAIMIDYDALMQGKTVENFHALADNLLVQLAAGEKKHWPHAAGISQAMVEKVFESMACPQAAGLAQYAYEATTKRSLFLLSPAMLLIVDHEDLYSGKPDPSLGNWNYNLSGQFPVSFYRGADGTFKQAPFIHFEYSATDRPPSNSPLPNNDRTTTLLSSSDDLQLSGNTKDQTYLCFYQDYSKQNNDKSTSGSNDANKTKPDDLFAGNSMLLLNTNPEALFNGPSGAGNVKATFASGVNVQYKYARIQMNPCLRVWLNGTLQLVRVGSTLGIFRQQMVIGRHYRLYRLHHGRYHEVDYPTSDTFLLPGDKITF